MEHESISGIVANLKGEITAYGKGAEKIFGYTKKEIMGKNVAIFHPPGAEELLGRLFKTAVETGIFEENLTLVRKSGEQFPAHIKVTAVKDDRGKITGLMGMTTDLSEQSSV